ncbi:hypothetical protein JTE90_003769 [Oedothorax gibbosus]|uniref:Uncharacterized protein n=1 Tax=Oedothorax gibbosus TaxID=931172 RepID=A0AAV6VAF1_9ARAC|nr:hypothetical protein JTE90_003769 [Oedothorax gibbosus]
MNLLEKCDNMKSKIVLNSTSSPVLNQVSSNLNDAKNSNVDSTPNCIQCTVPSNCVFNVVSTPKSNRLKSTTKKCISSALSLPANVGTNSGMYFNHDESIPPSNATHQATITAKEISITETVFVVCNQLVTTVSNIPNIIRKRLSLERISEVCHDRHNKSKRKSKKLIPDSNDETSGATSVVKTISRISYYYQRENPMHTKNATNVHPLIGDHGYLINTADHSSEMLSLQNQPKCIFVDGATLDEAEYRISPENIEILKDWSKPIANIYNGNKQPVKGQTNRVSSLKCPVPENASETSSPINEKSAPSNSSCTEKDNGITSSPNNEKSAPSNSSCTEKDNRIVYSNLESSLKCPVPENASETSSPNNEKSAPSNSSCTEKDNRIVYSNLESSLKCPVPENASKTSSPYNKKSTPSNSFCAEKDNGIVYSNLESSLKCPVSENASETTYPNNEKRAPPNSSCTEKNNWRFNSLNVTNIVLNDEVSEQLNNSPENLSIGERIRSRKRKCSMNRRKRGRRHHGQSGSRKVDTISSNGDIHSTMDGVKRGKLSITADPDLEIIYSSIPVVDLSKDKEDIQKFFMKLKNTSHGDKLNLIATEPFATEVATKEQTQKSNFDLNDDPPMPILTEIYSIAQKFKKRKRQYNSNVRSEQKIPKLTKVVDDSNSDCFLKATEVSKISFTEAVYQEDGIDKIQSYVNEGTETTDTLISDGENEKESNIENKTRESFSENNMETIALQRNKQEIHKTEMVKTPDKSSLSFRKNKFRKTDSSECSQEKTTLRKINSQFYFNLSKSKYKKLKTSENGKLKMHSKLKKQHKETVAKITWKHLNELKNSCSVTQRSVKLKNTYKSQKQFLKITKSVKRKKKNIVSNSQSTQTDEQSSIFVKNSPEPSFNLSDSQNPSLVKDSNTTYPGMKPCASCEKRKSLIKWALNKNRVVDCPECEIDKLCTMIISRVEKVYECGKHNANNLEDETRRLLEKAIDYSKYLANFCHLCTISLADLTFSESFNNSKQPISSDNLISDTSKESLSTETLKSGKSTDTVKSDHSTETVKSDQIDCEIISEYNSNQLHNTLFPFLNNQIQHSNGRWISNHLPNGQFIHNSNMFPSQVLTEPRCFNARNGTNSGGRLFIDPLPGSSMKESNLMAKGLKPTRYINPVLNSTNSSNSLRNVNQHNMDQRSQRLQQLYRDSEQLSQSRRDFDTRLVHPQALPYWNIHESLPNYANIDSRGEPLRYNDISTNFGPASVKNFYNMPEGHTNVNTQQFSGNEKPPSHNGFMNGSICNQIMLNRDIPSRIHLQKKLPPFTAIRQNSMSGNVSSSMMNTNNSGSSTTGMISPSQGSEDFLEMRTYLPMNANPFHKKMSMVDNVPNRGIFFEENSLNDFSIGRSARHSIGSANIDPSVLNADNSRNSAVSRATSSAYDRLIEDKGKTILKRGSVCGARSRFATARKNPAPRRFPGSLYNTTTQNPGASNKTTIQNPESSYNTTTQIPGSSDNTTIQIPGYLDYTQT